MQEGGEFVSATGRGEEFCDKAGQSGEAGGGAGKTREVHQRERQQRVLLRQEVLHTQQRQSVWIDHEGAKSAVQAVAADHGAAAKLAERVESGSGACQHLRTGLESQTGKCHGD